VRQRGFTVLEVVIASGVFALLLGTVALAVAGDQETARVLVAHMGPEMRARSALERITSDVRMAGEWGEDRNHNGVLEVGEDTNGNGVLDCDWSLPDGAVNAPSLSFNRRIDEMDDEGELVASGIYSRAVTYRLRGTELMREWGRTREDGTIETIRAIVAREVIGLRFSRTGALVTVSVDVRLPSIVSTTGVRTLTTSIWLRN